LAATTSLYSLYAYTDSTYSLADSSFVSSGLLNAGQCFNGLSATGAGPRTIEIYPDKTSCNGATTTYVISSGATRYFVLRGTVASVESGTTAIDSITVQLSGDAAFPVGAPDGQLMRTAANIGTDTNNDVIWSPVSTTTQSLITDLDFTNGFSVPGLPAVGMTQESIQSN